MEETGLSATGAQEDDQALLSNEGMPGGPNDGTFSIGPAEPVADPQQLPAVTATDEAGAVHGADVEQHPDNVPAQFDLTAPEPDPDAGEALPAPDELAALVAEVDLGSVDEVGFDPDSGAAATPGEGVS